MNKKKAGKKCFTLIELLVVIAIIAILAGLLIPTISSVMSNAKETEARTMAKNLVLAIKSYESEYGVLPVTGGADVEYDDVIDTSPTAEKTKADSQSYDTLVQILSKVDINDGDYCAVGGKSGEGNPRSTCFLQPTSDFATKGYLDPWDKRFIVIMDGDYTGAIASDCGSLNGSVFVYSCGLDGADDDGSDDDICSWK